MNNIKLPQLAWYGIKELVLPIPENWQVETHNMAGYNLPALTPDQIEAAVADTIGTPSIRELAKDKQQVVIIFDDMTRATRTCDILPAVLSELAAAGIADNQIRLICALGCHGTYTREHFAKKLGEDAMARFPVYNHNAFGNCTHVGKTTTYGTEVYVNEEVMKCDLKIAIGSVVPHPMNGFGGGGKMILPGVTSFETTRQNHESFYETAREPREHRIVGTGIFDENPMRMDIEEAARLAGLDIMINCLINTRGETTAVFSGALGPAYMAAVRVAKDHYLTPHAEGQDIVISNTFAKANEGFIGAAIGYGSVAQGGDVVLIANAPDGQVTHYLLGPFGNDSFAPMRQGARVPPHVNRLIVFSEYPDLASRSWFGESDRVIFRHKWNDVLELLASRKGDTKVTVYPNAEIQYCA
jgi:nickel-dependent lactate racemase